MGGGLFVFPRSCFFTAENAQRTLKSGEANGASGLGTKVDALARASSLSSTAVTNLS